MSLKVCDWKHGKSWVYSITYDEGLVDLHRFAIPLHEEFAIPGHVEVVAGHLGAVRQLGQSSYNGFRHMNGEELRDLLQRGWGVGNHSWSHEVITPEMVDRELRQAKETIEAAIQAPVLLYCAPGDNTNMSDHVLAACRQLGYLGAMSITDGVNRAGDELFWLDRSALHDQFYPPFYSEYDPYRNIRQAQVVGGWIIDYCHCPLEEPVHRNKDCSQAQLRQRFEAVLGEGGEAVWCAAPEEVISYHLCRRHLRLEVLEESPQRRRYRLGFAGLPPQVPCRQLTLEARVPGSWCRVPWVWVQGQPRPATLVRPGVLRLTVAVEEGMELELRGDQPAPWAKRV